MHNKYFLQSKDCVVEIVDDSVFEADETFQVKLSDLRGPEGASLGPHALATVTITNEEDGQSFIHFSTSIPALLIIFLFSFCHLFVPSRVHDRGAVE